MIHCVIHDGNQRERRRGPHVHAGEYDRQAEAGKQDPDVFDGGIGKQTFHVGLCSGEHNSIQRAEEPERERQQAPPPYRLIQQIKTHANHSIQRGFEHDAAHQCGNRRGRSRMRFRQPYVQWHQACLGAKADQRQAESDCGPMGTQVRGTHRIEREMPAAALKNAKAQQDGDRTEVGNQQVEKAGLTNFRNAMLCGDQKV